MVVDKRIVSFEGQFERGCSMFAREEWIEARLNLWRREGGYWILSSRFRIIQPFKTKELAIRRHNMDE